MNKVLLDTNFILTALQCKVDFFEDISRLGFEVLIPSAVIGEIKKIINSKKKLRFRKDAELALRILENNSFKEIECKTSYADKEIVRFLKKHPNVLLATMDKELKKKVTNPIMVIRARKKIEVV